MLGPQLVELFGKHYKVGPCGSRCATEVGFEFLKDYCYFQCSDSLMAVDHDVSSQLFFCSDIIN